VIGLSDNILFLNTHGDAVGESWLSRIVKKYIEQADINKTGSCHLFRHTMATLMLEGGADIRHIQAMLGHVRLETTEIYTQISIRHLQQIHAACHPAASNELRHDDDTQQFLDQALHGDGSEVTSREELLAALETEIVLENRPHAGFDSGEVGP
jgi:integrase/recombinase XerD